MLAKEETLFLPKAMKGYLELFWLTAAARTIWVYTFCVAEGKSIFLLAGLVKTFTDLFRNHFDGKGLHEGFEFWCDVWRGE